MTWIKGDADRVEVSYNDDRLRAGIHNVLLHRKSSAEARFKNNRAYRAFLELVDLITI